MLCLVATTVLMDLQLAVVGNTGDELVIACNETFEHWCDDRTGIIIIIILYGKFQFFKKWNFRAL